MNFFKFNNKKSLNKVNNVNKNSSQKEPNELETSIQEYTNSSQIQQPELETSSQEYTNSSLVEKKNNQIVKQNIRISYPEMKDKYHFFIGNFIKDHVQISILKDLKKKLRYQYKIDSRTSYDNFFLCFKNIYIGYMTNKEADYYMNNILSYLLNTIKQNIKKLTCHYTRFKLKYVKNHIRISLEYEDENNLLSNIIIPYINKKGIEPVYDRKIENSKPSIELIYMKPNQLIPNIHTEINIKVPTETFVIDKLTLIRGGLTKLRSGTPSKHDQLIFNNVRHYSYNFE
jgi:hypothetical protein